MCKLCNTDNIGTKRNSHRITKEILEFKNIAYDYIGEYPCCICTNNYGSYLKVTQQSARISVDEWITKKLRLKLFPANKSKYIKIRMNQIDYDDNIKIRNNIKDLKVSRKTIEKYIRKDEYRGRISYIFTYVKEKNKIKTTINKSFKTLEDAQSYKRKILNEKLIKC